MVSLVFFRLRYLLSGSTCWVHSRETFRCSLLHNSGSPNGRIKSRTFLGIGNVYHRTARKRLIRLLESVRVLIEGGSRNRDEIVLFLLLEASVLMSRRNEWPVETVSLVPFVVRIPRQIVSCYRPRYLNRPVHDHRHF